MAKKTNKCEICRETEKSPTVFRFRKLDDRVVCDFCLQSVIAPVSPNLLMEFLRDGSIIWEDKKKEQAYEKKMLESLSLGFDASMDTKLSGNVKISSDRYSVGEVDKNRVDETSMESSVKPKEIFKHLEEFVIGQDHAKKTVAVAAYNHFKRINADTTKKSNILMIGPTGVGKTYMITLLSKLLDLPFTIADANSVTQAGYVGSDVEDILANLYIKADKDLEKAQKGIVLIDEIDKIAHRPNPMGGRDISGRGVQEALLKIMEGGEFKVDVGSGQMKESILFNTKDVLFIVSGSFPEIEAVVNGRSMSADRTFFGGKPMTIPMTKEQAYNSVSNMDLERFGLLPEFLGRLPVRTVLQPLTEENLINIMTNTKDSVVDYYKDSLKADGVKLNITKGALGAIAKNALSNNTGARGLQTVFESILLDTMFDAPSSDKKSRISITKKMVEEKLQPKKEVKDATTD